MNTKLILLVNLIFFISCMSAKCQFVENGEIIFEVKTNLKKTLGNNSWSENMKDKLPNFKTSYYKYSFSGSKSLYQFDHWENKEAVPEMFRQSDEKSVWFTDFNSNKFNNNKEVFGSHFNIKDSISKIQWKLSNENRIIAGYNCRKATGKIMDSIYVFAFYTEEIIIPGGPCTVNGLPGMILAMTIPRLYTSWIATSVINNKTITNIPEPVESKNVFSKSQAVLTIKEKMQGWSNGDEDESNKWINQLIWNLLL